MNPRAAGRPLTSLIKLMRFEYVKRPQMPINTAFLGKVAFLSSDSACDNCTV